jgi:type II secretory pathway pseudopilin PulG
MRRAMGVGRRGPGLIGAAARTAVVAGTATAVSKSVSGSMDARAMQQQQMLAAQAANTQAAKSGAVTDDTITQLQKLADLQKQGFLTPEEFARQKARILGS